MKKIFYSRVTFNGTDYQMGEIFEAPYGEQFNGETSVYICQNHDLDSMYLKLCEGDNLGDIQQNYGPYNPVNICVIRAASGDPVEVWFAAETEEPED